MNRKGYMLFVAVSLFLAFVSACLSLAVGEVRIPLPEVANIILGKVGFPSSGAGASGVYDTILLFVRLPRTLMVFFVGSVLGVTGAVYQGLLLNPLAESYTLGVASGAALGATIAIAFNVNLVRLFAFLGGALTLLGVWALSHRSRSVDPTRLILSGVVVGSILQALMMLLQTLFPEKLGAFFFWVMGSFNSASWRWLPGCLIASCIALLFLLLHRELDIISLGEGKAETLGMNIVRMRWILLLAASLITSVVVSYCGVIGFVGLIVPHLLRMMVGHSHGRLLFASWMGGGLMLLWADVTARAIGSLPVGVLTALVGGPIFCLFLWKS
ncbi:MAG TPA: iron ABC transporter permease [Acetomicrobium flavidum]|nr:iron ABC transporter permease [Acetomicrobium mobile]HOJ82052.1 iron ABC transporter permease [Acetomicrobium flavidum]HOP87949.1 iron ABC transporter permease [Acetomicrobium flavidum]HPP13746.1 iron ABC transporter permease [Acetomicrobium flavidum]HPU68624.1 iron ABC transporter permease [Acetomicrobium flavidum]